MSKLKHKVTIMRNCDVDFDKWVNRFYRLPGIFSVNNRQQQADWDFVRAFLSYVCIDCPSDLGILEGLMSETWCGWEGSKAYTVRNCEEQKPTVTQIKNSLKYVLKCARAEAKTIHKLFAEEEIREKSKREYSGKQGTYYLALHDLTNNYATVCVKNVSDPEHVLYVVVVLDDAGETAEIGSASADIKTLPVDVLTAVMAYVTDYVSPIAKKQIKVPD